jgi:hypothetical protein
LSLWVVELLEDAEPDADGADGVAGLAGLAGLVEPELLEPVACASVSVTGAASTATPSRATSKDFIPHLLGQVGSKAGAIDCTRMRRPQ